MALPGVAAPSKPWRDSSPHKVTFVTVKREFRLEVFDWGGAGRAVVLLAGGGNTARVVDDFALRLRLARPIGRRETL